MIVMTMNSPPSSGCVEVLREPMADVMLADLVNCADVANNPLRGLDFG